MRTCRLRVALQALVFAAAPALGQALDAPQQRCVNALNKGGARVNAAQNRESLRCWARFQKGQEASAEGCWLTDPRQKVVAAADKVFAQQAKLCTGAATPPFAFTSAFVVTTAGREQSLFFLEDLFGATPDAPAQVGATDPDVARCQKDAIQGGHKLEQSFLASANRAKKNALKGTKQMAQAGNAPALTSMIDSAVIADQKLTLRSEKLGHRLAERCALDGAVLVDAFPGCSATSPIALAGCVVFSARCRACSKLSEMDDLALDCDFADDGVSNSSCLITPGPTGTPGFTGTPEPTPTFGPTPGF